MEEKKSEGQEESPNPAALNKLIGDLKSFLAELESEGYSKESLVILLSKFETSFKQDSNNIPEEVSTTMKAFIQHGFEYAEGKEGQTPLIHDLEHIQKELLKVKESLQGEL